MTQSAGRSPSSIDDVLSEYGGLEAQLSDPALHEDAAAARRVGKRFAELTPVVQCHRALETTRDEDRFRRLEALVGGVEALVRAEAFLPSEQSFACSDCPYGEACKAWHRCRTAHRVSFGTAA